jgi:carboxylesterase type B
VWNNSHPGIDSWIGPYQGYHQLSDLMSRSWISFAYELDPNGHGLENVPHWPEYTSSAPQNMVFRTEKHSGGSVVEQDDWREEQIAWFNSHWNL